MKTSMIENHLLEYDNNKGLFRTYIKDEPHIKELRQFLLGINEDRELTNEECLCVVKIILGKRTWNESESSLILTSLANHFGGIKALSFLREHDELNAQNIVLLTKQKEIAEDLAKLIVLLKNYHFSDEIQIDNLDFNNLDEKLSTIIDCFNNNLLNKNTFILLMNSIWPALCTEIISLLNHYGLFKNNLIDQLQDVKDKQIFLKQILFIFDAVDQNLFSEKNIIGLLKLNKKLDLIYSLITELLYAHQLTQQNLDLLLSSADAISDKTLELVSFFRLAGWSIFQNFKMILAHHSDAEEIIKAAVELNSLNLNSMHAQEVIVQIFKKPSKYQQIINAVRIALEQNIIDDPQALYFVLISPETANKLVSAINILRSKDLYNKETKYYIFFSTNPESIASGIVQLILGGHYTIESRNILFANEKKGGTLALILRQLITSNLFEKNYEQSMTNLHFLNDKKLIKDETVTLFSLLHEFDLLNQDNFLILGEFVEQLDRLNKSCAELAAENNLTQTTFNHLLLSMREEATVVMENGKHVNIKNQSKFINHFKTKWGAVSFFEAQKKNKQGDELIVSPHQSQ